MAILWRRSTGDDLQPGIALLGKSALSLSYEDLSNSEAIPSTTALGEMRERVHFDANIEW
jgi:hypothetical protein